MDGLDALFSGADAILSLSADDHDITTVIKATTDVVVNGQTLHRETDGTGTNSGPAQKIWVNANIQINPPTADNPVATNHVLTITVNALNGTLAAGTATASIVSGPGSFVGSPTCNYAGGAATASCTVTITSVFSGTTVIQATSNITVAGQTVNVTQAGIPCSYTVSPTSLSPVAGASSGSVGVTTTAGCAWTATEGAAWITIAVLLVWAWRRWSPDVGLLSALVLTTAFGFLHIH